MLEPCEDLEPDPKSLPNILPTLENDDEDDDAGWDWMSGGV